MRVDAFDFELPPERVALEPASPRDSARMLVVGEGGALTDVRISDLPALLRPGDALVVNDTKVIAAQLEGVRVRGDAIASVEATLIKRVDDCRWAALVRPAKKLRVGERIRFGDTRENAACFLASLDAVVERKDEGGEALLRFDFSGVALDEGIERLGRPPLPPYISGKRATSDKDRADYQTMFAAEPGAVAAPTAGLHFTPELVARIEARGVHLHRVTLHVGAGTFLPVKVENARDHKMHSEWGEVDDATAAALNASRGSGGRIIAVGTTSARVLESATDEEGRVRAFRGRRQFSSCPAIAFMRLTRFLLTFICRAPRSSCWSAPSVVLRR